MKLLLLAILMVLGTFAYGQRRVLNYKGNRFAAEVPETKEKTFYGKVAQMKEDSCEQCKTKVAQAAAQLEDPEFLKTSKQQTKEGCELTILPELKEECEIFAQAFIEELISLVANPEKFCEEIGLCSSEPSFNLLKLAAKNVIYKLYPKALESGNPFCEFCTRGIAAAADLLKDKNVQDDLKNALGSLCNMLGSMEQDCDNLVDNYFPGLIDELEELFSNPQWACEELGLCSSTQ